jgi:hypothetical protein
MLDLPFALIHATDATKRQFELDRAGNAGRASASAPPRESATRRARLILAGALERASHAVAPAECHPVR